MTADEFFTHMAFRLLIPQFPGNRTCRCSAALDAFGVHALNCSGRAMIARHDIVASALHTLAFQAQLQPKWKDQSITCLGESWRTTSGSRASSSSSSRSSLTAFRPADISVRWDNSPKLTCIDVTVVSPLKATMSLKFLPGAVAQTAENEKFTKHADACFDAGYNFLPFAVDCLGGLTPSSAGTLTRIASALVTIHGFPEYLARQLVFRRLSFAIHLGTVRQLLVATAPLPPTYQPIHPFSNIPS